MIKKLTKKTGEIIAVRFPDDGPNQCEISNIIKSWGFNTNLYDGLVERDIKTSTDANWRWKSISIDGIYEWAKVGDWIVKDLDNKLRIYTNESFQILFKEIES